MSHDKAFFDLKAIGIRAGMSTKTSLKKQKQRHFRVKSLRAFSVLCLHSSVCDSGYYTPILMLCKDSALRKEKGKEGGKEREKKRKRRKKEKSPPSAELQVDGPVLGPVGWMGLVLSEQS